MTRLLSRAIEATKALSPELQDQAARLLLLNAGIEVTDEAPVSLTAAEKAAIDIGLAAAERGDFATEADLQAIRAAYTQ